MKDFDQERQARVNRERTFRIGGEEFTYRPAVSPEALLPYNTAITGDSRPSEAEWIELYDETIRALLDPGQEEKWATVRNPDVENPISIQDLSGLLQWLLEEQVGRPTGQPSDSSTSSDGNGTHSKDDSSSKAETSKESVPAKP